MSNLSKIDLYKPELLNLEIQHFRNDCVCWFSGPYYTRQKVFKSSFPFEITGAKLRFQPTISMQSSLFYKSFRNKTIQFQNQSASLLYVYIKQWMVGCTVGFQKALRIRGVGYKFSILPTKLIIQAGYSHLLRVVLPSWRSIMSNKKSTLIHIKTEDLVKLSTFLSGIRNLRKPDVYKGKGIRYRKDLVMRKEGKKKKSN